MEFERRRRRSFLGLEVEGLEVEGREAPVFSARRSRSSSERASGEEAREWAVEGGKRDEGGKGREGRWSVSSARFQEGELLPSEVALESTLVAYSLSEKAAEVQDIAPRDLYLPRTGEET